MSDITTTARNVDLGEMVRLLGEQKAHKVDAVVPLQAIEAVGSRIRIAGIGAGSSFGMGEAVDLSPTPIALGHLADKTGVPAAYLRRLHDDRTDIFAANVNGWLQGSILGRPTADSSDLRLPLDGKVMVRTFSTLDDEDPGLLRAIVSQSYKAIDNLDVLTAAFDGIRAGGLGDSIKVLRTDLSERRMVVKISAPSISVIAEELFKNYRSPFSGKSGADLPIVQAGIEISNSETGGGSFTVCPYLVAEVCSNGMKITKDAHRKIHIGGRLDEGIVTWSEATLEANLALVTSQAADAVTTFLSEDYVSRVVAGIEETSGKRLENPADDVTIIAQRMRYTEAQTKGILDHFIMGGDPTAGGVLHAVTSFAQTVEDPDEAFDLEGSAFTAFDLAGRL